MLYRNDNMCYINVYSKMYSCHYRDIGRCFEDFYLILKKANVNRLGDLFYTFNKITESENVELVIFQSAKKYYGEIDGIEFYSFYQMDNMLSVVVTEQFENVENAYAELMQYAEQTKAHLVSNIYNTIHSSGKQKYLIIKVQIRGEKQ